MIQVVDLIVEPEWLIPVVPSCKPLSGQAIVVSEGTIIDILPIAIADSRYQAKQHQRLTGQALIPGLINTHTHAAMTLMRGLADDISLMSWLERHIWPAEKAQVTSRFVRDGSLLACAEMLAGGVTCFNDMYFFPQATAEAAMQAGIRAQLGLVVLEFPTNYAADADDYLQKGLAARDEWRGQPLLTSSLAPHAPYTVADSTFEKIRTYADQLGLGIHIHLHETAHEIEESQRQFRLRPLERLANLRILGPEVLAVHCVHMNAADMSLLRQYGCHIAHCPTSNLKLASGISPVKEMSEAGLNISLGTDGAASNNRLDMFAEMRLAALLVKGVNHDATLLPAAAVLEMATINAARALGMEDRIGSLEKGKIADMVAINLTELETSPCYDPLSQLIYTCGREHVTHVWVAGELRYQKQHQIGIFAGIEPAELKEISTRWQHIMQAYQA